MDILRVWQSEIDNEPSTRMMISIDVVAVVYLLLHFRSSLVVSMCNVYPILVTSFIVRIGD